MFEELGMVETVENKGTQPAVMRVIELVQLEIEGINGPAQHPQTATGSVI